MYKYTVLCGLVLLGLACHDSNYPKGVFYCAATKDSAKFANTDCYWQKLDFQDNDFVIGTTKNGQEIKGRIAYDAKKEHVGVILSTDPTLNLFLTIKENTQTLEGRGYLFKR
jgi:hypothetical protein